MKIQTQLKKMSVKLIAAAVSLVILVTMTVSVSYAWITLSKNPAVSGAQIAIAGGNTILLAADLTETVTMEGEQVTVHYPGAFSENLVFSQYDSYGYLGGLAGLTPVSTSDGVYFITKTENGYTYDNSLQHANLDHSYKNGHYVYLDFWVVSPGSDYYLRVSADTGASYRGSDDNRANQGSSLVELPVAVTDGTAVSGLRLQMPDNNIASCVRVGFLSNEDNANNADALAYTRSDGYDGRYTSLKGAYQNPGEQPDADAHNRFTVYEPNGTLHTAQNAEQGAYYITSPLSYDPLNNVYFEADMRSKLTVQKNSGWVSNFDQVFQTGISGRSVTEDNAVSTFFDEFLQWQTTPYINAGRFFTNTSTLYDNMTNGSVAADIVEQNLVTAGATDDVYITQLQRNTPQRIRMFIWIEGQDIDCAESNARQSAFVLNLELAGANN